MTMRKTAYPDAGTAISIATEMAVSVKSIIDALPILGEKTKNRSIADEIKRAADTARMISLRVVTLVLDHMSSLVEQIESGQLSMEESKREAILASLNSVHRYVNGVAGGKIASGLSLHSAYVDFMRFMPSETVASRQEFFLPIDPVYGPNSPNYDKGRFIAEVARYNDEFRQSMRRYEAKKDLETVNAMRTTLVTMETKNPPSNFRMLLSLAISFMDVAMRNSGKINKENESLLVRLERELSGVVNGELDIEEGTISWFMSVIGQASQFSARIRSFQESYELVRLVEEAQNTSVNDQTIAQMRSAMDNAQRTWESSIVVGGDLAAARNACFALVAVSNIMGDYVLKTMAMALGSLADGILEKRVSADPEMAVFGAAILVSMNERLERISTDPKGGRAAAEQHRDRVRAVLSGKRPSELNKESTGQGGHIQAILDELGNDISSAEQIIDQCLRDGAKDSKREEAAKLFTMISSALSFVNLADAAGFATTVAGHVDKIIVGLLDQQQPSDTDKRILAESVMMLHRYIDIINLDQLQAGEALRRGISLFMVQEAVVATNEAEKDSVFDVCTDEDLGPIFFEEAKGVVADLILPGLIKLRSNINDEATMLDVRRGFHTLKGSARMVELNNLGMIGQHAEYALNVFRDNRNIKPDSSLLDWLEEAANFFAQAVGVLEQGKPAPVNVLPYEAVYKHLSETNVFSRVDLKKAASPVVDIPLSKDVPSINESVAPAEIEVHIPETGTVILPAPDILAGGVQVSSEQEVKGASVQAEHQAIALEEDLQLESASPEVVDMDIPTSITPQSPEEEKPAIALDAPVEHKHEEVADIDLEQPLSDISKIDEPVDGVASELPEIESLVSAPVVTADLVPELPSLPTLEALDPQESVETQAPVQEADLPVLDLVTEEPAAPAPAIEEAEPVVMAETEIAPAETTSAEQEPIAEPVAEPVQEVLPVVEEVAPAPESIDFALSFIESLVDEKFEESATQTAPIEAAAPEVNEAGEIIHVSEGVVLDSSEQGTPVLLEPADAMQQMFLTPETASADTIPEEVAPIETAEEEFIGEDMPAPVVELTDFGSLEIAMDAVEEAEETTPLPTRTESVDGEQEAPVLPVPVAEVDIELPAIGFVIEEQKASDGPPGLPPDPDPQGSIEIVDSSAKTHFEIEFENNERVAVPMLPVSEHNELPVLTEVVPSEFAPIPESLVSVSESITETPAESSGEVEVGSITLPTQIYNAFLNDGRVFQNGLQESITDAILGKRKSVDFEVMRMAHSLAGMGRTTGLVGVTHLAECVEAWVSINQDRDLHLTDDAKAVLSDAMEALDAMIMGVADKIEPEMEKTIVARLQSVINADEHRIAMAVDMRADVTDLVLEQLNDGDVMVTDEGVTPTASSIIGESALNEIQKAGSADAEVAKVPGPFRHSTEPTPSKSTGIEGNDSVDVVEEPSATEGGQAIDHGQNHPVVQGLDGRVLSESGFIDLDLSLSDSVALEIGVSAAPHGRMDDVQEISESISAHMGSLLAHMEAIPHADTSPKRETAPEAFDWLAIVRTRVDDVDPEMFDIFLEEADVRFAEIDATLDALGTAINDKKLTNVLKRAVHTLKGSANTAGCRRLGVIFHHMEDMMETKPVLTFDSLAVLQSGVDVAFAAMTAMRKDKDLEEAIKRVIKSFKKASVSPGTDSAEIVESSQIHADKSHGVLEVQDIEESHSTITIAQSTTNLAVENTTTKTVDSAPSKPVPAKDRADKAKGTNKSDSEESNLRVSTRLLDKMVKSVGEINISRSRVSMNVDITKMSLTGLASSLDLMYGYLRQVELEAERQMSSGDQGLGRDSTFDALQMDRFTRLQELTRRVAEAQSDVMAQQGSAIGAVRDMEEALANQNVLVNEVSSDLDQIRQVRVSSVVPVLKRVVRAACRDTEKLGEIFFDADVEIDRGILAKVMGSLEHILRNAIAHGIESPQDRLAEGKNEAGTIEFRAYQDGGEVVIEIHDDGRGMDTKRIFESAVKKGVIKAGTKLSETQIRELIFEPGFSTAAQVTDIAGRGVGLDVVRSDISAMGGRVTVNSVMGLGSTFVLRVPATLTVISGAAVLTNNHMYVIPVSFIDRLVRIGGDELDKAYASKKLVIQEQGSSPVEYEFWGMWQIAGAKMWDSTKSWRNSVLLMSNDRVAVHIDEIRPATDFVFRALGPQVANNSGLIGSTIGSNGNASLVIDPSRVARTLRSLADAGVVGIADQKKAPLVLVVDDSTTVRKVTARMLKREGYRCLEAENGMKALEMLQGELPDVILMDIEMPVMNGYDASQAIRATPQTSDIPIIMITSRAGESHRQRAMEIGVNEYLGKPYNENDLIRLIRRFTGEDNVQRVVNG